MPSDNGGYANDINDNGWVVGCASGLNGSRRAFRWRNGTTEDLGTPGTFGEARAINNSGIIAGYYLTSSTSHAFVWDNGVMSDLGVSCDAYGINDNGWVVGSSSNRAVLWTPVPEPSSLIALLGAITSMSYVNLRKNGSR